MTSPSSSEQQEYERKRDAHRAADQAAGNRSGDSGLTGSAPASAVPLEKPREGATPRTDAALGGYEHLNPNIIDFARQLEHELQQTRLEHDSARNVLARAISRERLANMRATEWEEAAQEVANRETLSAAYWKDRADAFEALHVAALSAKQRMVHACWRYRNEKTGEETLTHQPPDRLLFAGDYAVTELFAVDPLAAADNTTAQEGKDA